MTEPTPSDLIVDKNAYIEATAVASGKDLANRKELNEANRLFREDKAESHIHRITVFYLYGIAISGAVGFGIVIWHLFTPWRFLSEDQLLHVQEFILSGGAGIFLDRAAKSVK